MKKLYFLFFLTIGFLGNAQIINFPDANFKAKLLQASPSNQIASTEEPVFNTSNNSWTITTGHVVDLNGDGEIQVSEAQVIKFLNLDYGNIVDLTGIEFFSNLKSLSCNYNQLTNLNIQTLTNLITLSCSSNQIQSLNVSNLTNLEKIQCTNNLLNNLIVSGLTNLKYLSCFSNQLGVLDVSGLTSLKELRCGNNLLPSLNLSGLTNLIVLACQYNQLPSLNVSDLNNLELLMFNNNYLTSIDLSNLTNLETLNCDNNSLTSLNISNLSSLRFLYCINNQLISIDFSGLINLERLDCRGNQITGLNVSGFPNMYFLRCDDNLLTFLYIKNNNTSNWAIYPNANGTGLSFSGNMALEYICVDEGDIVLLQQKINDYGYTNCNLNSYCSFNPGGTFYEILGNTKFDSNYNGCDVLDINFPNLKFTISNGILTGSLISNSSGDYYIPVSSGNHTITPNLENPSYFNISPTSVTVDFPTQASPFTPDFCVTVNGVHSDVEIVLVPTTPARPGFDADYKLVYRNKGNQIENGSVSLTFDDLRLDYVSSNPVYDSSATNSFTWNYTNLQPFETREVEITFNVNSPMETPAVNNGDVLNYTTTITSANTDETSTDNTFTLDQTVVGSYDPNDKMCLEGTTITPSEVGKYVHYVIRFENTGTYPAENIVVKDMIDLAKFDIATLVPLKSSHDFYTRINGNKVEFIFENINLDFNDATNDGYVAFKIKTKPTLVVGNTFTNNANIYFDYNFPITTNTYTTTVVALSTQDFDFGTYYTLYPNPAKDVLNIIQSKQNVNINSVEIYNQLGQIVMATTNDINSIDVANLASGTYFVKINTEKGSANAKFVKE